MNITQEWICYAATTEYKGTKMYIFSQNLCKSK